MAKEATHRKRAKEELLEQGYIISTPCRSRYGAFVTDWGDDSKRGDDLFNVVDMVGWKKDEIIFVQYTDLSHVGSHITKIEDVLDKHDLTVPDGIVFEVWGYENRKGYTRKETI